MGFNRPNFIRDRLIELESLKMKDLSIYLSVDGPRDGIPKDILAIDEIKTIYRESSIARAVQPWFSPVNRGCDGHIFNSIDRVLQENDCLLVIEDDVSISPIAIVDMLSQAAICLERGMINPIVAVSGFARKFVLTRNRWRLSKYFCAWGFVLNKEFWQIHKATLKLQDPVVLEELFSNSHTWHSMSKRKRSIWAERICRSNYDYLIQRTLFLKGLHTIAPIFRISDNLGHGSTGAVHTRFKTPFFLRFLVFGKNTIFRNEIVSGKKINWLLAWLDSQTWAGDGLLSVRGRNRGIRSSLRKTIESLGYERY